MARSGLKRCSLYVRPCVSQFPGASSAATMRAVSTSPGGRWLRVHAAAYDLNLRDLSDEELERAWDLWFDLAQITNDADPAHTHGVFIRATPTRSHRSLSREESLPDE
jgi:hypothetical protein